LKMRLSAKEIKVLKDTLKSMSDEAKIYLFGSRVDDAKKGGDIDLYVIPKEKTQTFAKKAKLQIMLEDTLFKPVDIVVSYDDTRLIEKEAKENGIKL